MESITFQLTKKQYRQLTPLFDRAKRDIKYRESGMVIMQPKIFVDGEECLDVIAGFVPHEQAVKIVDALGGE